MLSQAYRGGSARIVSPVILCVIAAALVMSAALGVRQTFGLFIGPLSFEHGLPVTLIAFAIALHNLVWGIAQPFAGAAADRYGAAPVVAFGAIAFAIGLAAAAVSPSGAMLVLSMGVLVGIGISCTSFGVVLTAVGRAASTEQRSMAMGLASAGGSVGQVLLVPLAQGVSALSGTAVSLIVLAGCLVLAAPLGILLDRRGRDGARPQDPAPAPLASAVALALQHRGYRLLTLGFFTCGFQLAFIATHLPNYLSLCHMPVGLGATALALVGLFNMAGSWGCGWLGGRFRQQHVLGVALFDQGRCHRPLLPAAEIAGVSHDFRSDHGPCLAGYRSLDQRPGRQGLRDAPSRHALRRLLPQPPDRLVPGRLGRRLRARRDRVIRAIWSATAAAGLVAALLHFPINDAPAAVAVPARA